MSHDVVEKKVGLLGALIAVVISIGGLVEIVPLYAQQSVIEPAPGVKPYAPLALEGRDVYVREGCYNCHSQMVRPLPAETESYGHYSLAGEAVYVHPFQFGVMDVFPPHRSHGLPCGRARHDLLQEILGED